MKTSTVPQQQTLTPLDKTRVFMTWHRRILGFCLVIFAFEIGIFLLVFPWLDNWDLSWIPLHSPKLSDLWMSHYFRGALSGLGFLNIYVALAELYKQLKQAFGYK
jgi:hypothetical protein